ncbi:MAG: helix-turn-helix domain-containing protein [Pseudomonadota bacterium]
MLRLDRKRLESVLAARGLSLAGLAKACGISRQSIYNMFRGRSVLSAPLEKIIRELRTGLPDIVVEDASEDGVFARAPEKVQDAVVVLKGYALRESADLFLIGSRARRKRGVRSDWDFAIYFPDGRHRHSLASVKAKASDAAFPHRIDVVCLNFAPPWFMKSIEASAKRIVGETTTAAIFKGAPGTRPNRRAA